MVGDAVRPTMEEQHPGGFTTCMTEECRPEWWDELERVKETMGLPPYEPPRFEDGTYAYEIVDRLGAEHDCRVRLLGVDTRYQDDWEVRIDGETAFEVGRVRDDNGNTVYQMTGDEFARAVEKALNASGHEN